ncbi:MAG TPA: hypothetical protein P5155_03345, partial [Candidatus Absconditabacterales bacterium]|nr:hypothetical protein [Candidatus Absconditabacterales bacterium]
MPKQYPTPIKEGTIDDVRLGSHIVFEEVDEKGILHQCTGLEYIVKIKPNIVVVDNHDRVLEFREKGLPVIHIDQHTDMRLVGPEGVNVGNFLRHALDTGLVPSVKQVNTEYTLTTLDLGVFDFEKGVILDVDLDFWHPDMSIENYQKTIDITKELIKKSRVVTIATSPYFLDQNLALK